MGAGFGGSDFLIQGYEKDIKRLKQEISKDSCPGVLTMTANVPYDPSYLSFC